MKMTILVVDADELLQQFLVEFLASQGYEVLAASNGREAMKILCS
ncbi:MAG: hypothetical protein ACUVWX_09900 [Kiritimatiellia bacterium]